MAKPRGGGTLHALFEVNERERREYVDRMDRITRGERVPPLHVVSDPPTTVVETHPATVDDYPTSTVVTDTAVTVVADLTTSANLLSDSAFLPSTTVAVDDRREPVPGSTTTVASVPPATVVVGRLEFGTLWKVEGSDVLVPASRVRPIKQAQDALTHTEESVYDFLWGSRLTKDDYRIIEVGYNRISKAARVSKRNAALITERLVHKGFLTVEKRAELRTGTRYRVLSYKMILDDFARLGRSSVIRLGNGVLFVHPVQVSATRLTPSTTAVPDPSTTVYVGISTTVVAATTATVDTDVSTTVVAATTPLDKTTQTTETPSSSAPQPGPIAEAAARLGLVLDDDAARRLLRQCRTADPEATEPEVAHFLVLKASQLRNKRNVGNLIGLLLASVPAYFEAPATELWRHRQAQVAAAEERRAHDREGRVAAEAVLRDPDASAWELENAGQILKVLGPEFR